MYKKEKIELNKGKKSVGKKIIMMCEYMAYKGTPKSI